MLVVVTNRPAGDQPAAGHACKRDDDDGRRRLMDDADRLREKAGSALKRKSKRMPWNED